MGLDIFRPDVVVTETGFHWKPVQQFSVPGCGAPRGVLPNFRESDLNRDGVVSPGELSKLQASRGATNLLLILLATRDDSIESVSGLLKHAPKNILAQLFETGFSHFNPKLDAMFQSFHRSYPLLSEEIVSLVDVKNRDFVQIKLFRGAFITAAAMRTLSSSNGHLRIVAMLADVADWRSASRMSAERTAELLKLAPDELLAKAFSHSLVQEDLSLNLLGMHDTLSKFYGANPERFERILDSLGESERALIKRTVFKY